MRLQQHATPFLLAWCTEVYTSLCHGVMFSSVQCCAGSCTQGRHLLGPWTPPTTLQCTVHCTVQYIACILHHPFTRIVGWAVGWLVENDALQEALIITILSLTCHLFVYFLLDILHQFRSHLHILLSFKFSVHTHRILSMQAARVGGGACLRNLM